MTRVSGRVNGIDADGRLLVETGGEWSLLGRDVEIIGITRKTEESVPVVEPRLGKVITLDLRDAVVILDQVIADLETRAPENAHDCFRDWGWTHKRGWIEKLKFVRESML